MNSRLLSAAGAALCVALACPALAETRYILETKPAVDPAPLAARYSLRLGRSWRDQQHAAWSVSTAAPLTVTTIAAIRGAAGVLEFERDAEYPGAEAHSASRAQAAPEALTEQLALSSTVPFFGSHVRESYVRQPATRIVSLLDALQRFGAGSVATVAIIDTGVDPKHLALSRVLVPGYDFTRELPGQASEWADLDPATVAALDQSTVILEGKQTPVRLNQSTVVILDQSTVVILDGGKIPLAFGHGTMVAGLVHLIAPQARIMPLKAFRGDGSASLSHIARAVFYAADHGATIISMSFSMSSPSAELKRALAYAASKGVICVASAGNEGADRVVYPSAFNKVLGVGSTNYADRRSAFSNFGGSVRTSAPGEAVITTYPGNHYAGVWGTSFSTAQVAGAVALMQQARPKATFDQVKDAFDHGQRISQDMGDARLSLVNSILHSLLN